MFDKAALRFALFIGAVFSCAAGVSVIITAILYRLPWLVVLIAFGLMLIAVGILCFIKSESLKGGHRDR